MIRWRHAVIAVLIAWFVILLGHSVWAQIGQIKNVAGQVSLVRNNVQQPAKTGDLLEQADVLTTGPMVVLGSPSLITLASLPDQTVGLSSSSFVLIPPPKKAIS